MSDAAAGRRRRNPRGEGNQLRAELLTAARSVLVDTGDDAQVTARNVAQAASVATSAIYLHFSSIDELRYELAYTEFGEHLSRALTAVAGASMKQRLRARGQAIISFAFQYPGLYRMLFMDDAAGVPDRFQGLDDIRATNLGPMIRDLSAQRHTGASAPHDPEVVACLLWMGVHGLASLVITLEDFPWPDRDRLVEGMLDLLETLHGVPPEP